MKPERLGCWELMQITERKSFWRRTEGETHTSVQTTCDTVTKEHPDLPANTADFKINPYSPPPKALPGERPCVTRAHARAAHRLLGCRLFPPDLPVSRRASGPPNGRGRRKMAAAVNSGSSLPLFDCPTWLVMGFLGLERLGVS